MEIILPRQFRANALFPFVEEHFEQMSVIPDRVTFDFSDLNFALPSGVVFLNNLSRFLARNRCEVAFQGMDVSKQAIKYLDDALFFEQHLDSKLSWGSVPRRTTQPLQEIRHLDSRSSFALARRTGRRARNDSKARPQSASFIFVNIDGSLQIRRFPMNRQEEPAGILVRLGESIRSHDLGS